MNWSFTDCIDDVIQDANLYIGTSAAEILHFVCIPTESAEDTSENSFILASRRPIPYSQHTSPGPDQRGVQQIILLPTVNKACILCNGTVTFYLTPELSPAFNNTKVNNCRWIGGLDQNADLDGAENPVVMIAEQNRIKLVRVGDEARLVRNIQFPGCLTGLRRDTIACVADTHEYSLLDVEHQQKIPLFPISSSSEVFESGQVEDIPLASSNFPQRSSSSSYPNTPGGGSAHARSSSLDLFSPDRSTSGTPELSVATETPRSSSSQERKSSDSARPQPTAQNSQSVDPEASKPLPPLPKQSTSSLKPHVVSPTPSEFLLVTGTEVSEPGVGMFVNMDGDVVPRGTISFEKYPESIVIDKGDGNDLLKTDDDTQGEHVLAVIDAGQDGEVCKRLEMQRWDLDPGEAQNPKSWMEIPLGEAGLSTHVGLRHTVSPSELEFSEMGHLLRKVRLETPALSPARPAGDPRTQASIQQIQKEKELFESQELTDSEGSKKGDTSDREWETDRNNEEARFARGLGRVRGSLVMFQGNQIWRVLRNPLAIQLDDSLQNARRIVDDHEDLHRDAIVEIIDSILEVEPKSEAEFIGLSYVKQKASLLLLESLITAEPDARSDAAIDATERALIVGDLDPRVPLLLIPSLQREVLQGPQGIWIHAGLARIAETLIQDSEKIKTIDSRVQDMIKRYLFSWQQKRGYGSIVDDTYVFDSVDAALLHLLLEQDSNMTAEQRAASGVRTELNRLVNKWKGNFDRAVVLLEAYQRLFTLSRLYQGPRMSRNVLKIWQRIIGGEANHGGDTDDGVDVTIPGIGMQMRKYLARIKDAQLVEEYGAWLAEWNPSLGVQVFADDESRVKLEPADVINLLKERAPNAVQVYLEHLVFSKKVSNAD